ncbi:hypothetical protein GGX14DRAFT_481219 [Mycena pura]|uniref:EF-hand domain-containing protein n=1 Tax=Mycena pura TaxID=153505 RepID=A0AAD6UPC8_9AGAR|nr:hypothetical protein GGX14DRAFT_481219 [Mycena pura]
MPVSHRYEALTMSRFFRRNKAKTGGSDGSLLLPSKPEPYAPADGAPDGKTAMWQEISNREANTTGSGIFLHRVGGVAIGAVNAASSSDGLIGVAKGEWQLLGATILETIPGIMVELEQLSRIHPFVQAAYLPFKLFCDMEIMRRDNDNKRTLLFGTIKDAMLVLLELQSIGTNDTRTTPDGKPMLGRLAQICQDLSKDIGICYKALGAQDKRKRYLSKFWNASNWNRELAKYATHFTRRRDELLFALSLRTAITIEEVDKNMKKMLEQFSAFDGLGGVINKYFKGSHSRVKDKMVAAVWKSQGWDKTATTSKLVSGISKYVVQSAYTSTNPEEESDDDSVTCNDSETTTSAATLLDSDRWVAQFVQGERLRYVRQAIDPDCSGSVSIDEINAFTKAKPKDWSFLRWAAYWAIGWQIFATRYCAEIDFLFGQMRQLQTQIVEPDNKRSAIDYIDSTERHVSALTSAIERHDSAPSWLAEQFASYVNAQEGRLKKRLDDIQYNIDTPKKFSSVLNGARFEEVVFALLVLLMRRHLDTLRVGLNQEIDGKLAAHAATIGWVAKAARYRYDELRGSQRHLDVFEWLSCGLFKNYLRDGASVQYNHSMNSNVRFPGNAGHGESASTSIFAGGAEPTAYDDSYGTVFRTPSQRAPVGADPQLWRDFLAVDTDRSGEISADELQSVLFNSDHTRFDIRTVRTLMTLFDNDYSGTIDFNEFAGLWRFVYNWKRVFDLFDRDHSGSIDKDELREALLAQFRRELSPNLLDLLLRKYAASDTVTERGVPVGFSFDAFLRAVVFVKELGEEFQQVGPNRDGLIRMRYEKFMEMALHLL